MAIIDIISPLTICVRLDHRGDYVSPIKNAFKKIQETTKITKLSFGAGMIEGLVNLVNKKKDVTEMEISYDDIWSDPRARILSTDFEHVQKLSVRSEAISSFREWQTMSQLRFLRVYLSREDNKDELRDLVTHASGNLETLDITTVSGISFENCPKLCKLRNLSYRVLCVSSLDSVEKTIKCAEVLFPELESLMVSFTEGNNNNNFVCVCNKRFSSLKIY
jgi:hypothetical protein